MNTLYQNNDIYTKILKLPFVQNIFKRHEVIAVMLGGSRLLNMSSPTSDYDVDILLEGDAQLCHNGSQDMYFLINGYKVHFYIHDRSWFLNSLGGHERRWWVEITVYAMQHICLSKEHILYCNPKYEAYIDNLIDNRDIICQWGLFHMLSYKDWILENFYNNKYVKKEVYVPILCFAKWCRQEIDLEHLKYNKLHWDQPEVMHESFSTLKHILSELAEYQVDFQQLTQDALEVYKWQSL